MDKKMKLRRIGIMLLTAAVIVLPPVLYSRLMVMGNEGAYMYGNYRFFLVGVVSVLGGVGLFNLLRVASFQKEEPIEEEEELLPEDEQEADIEDHSVTMEEYPELFLKKEEAEAADSPPSYIEALTAALNAQKAEYTEEKSEECEIPLDDEVEGFLFAEKKDEPRAEDWLDLPDTLPEGYCAYEEEGDEEEEFSYNIDEEGVSEPPSTVGRVLKRVIVSVLLAAIPLGFAVLMSRFRTDYYSDGIVVSTLTGEKSYSWEDCISYELSPSFSGSQLSFVLTMSDGATVELLPSDYIVLGDGFDSSYAYASYVGEILDTKGAEKHVRERNTIEQGFADSDDAGEYVRKLID